MWLAALCIWGILLTFSACDSCPEPEDAASWLKLKPLGHCEDEENFCPYRITLPPLSIQLPRPFRELEKMAKELQNLKEVVNRLRRDCQECRERQRAERGGWKDHSEEEERRTQSSRHNFSSTERQSHNPSGEQAVRIVTSTLPQKKTPGTEGIIRGGVKRLNHSGLERQGWNIDRRADSDQGSIDLNSELSREVEIFDPSLEETPEDMSEVKLVLSPTTKETERELKFQPGELLQSSIPRTKDTVQSATHGSEMDREVKIFNPLPEETPEDISEVKHAFSPTTEVTERELKFQPGELLQSSIPRTKDIVQSATHGSELNREVKIFNPLPEDTPVDIPEVKHAFSPTTEETERELQGELLESSIPKTKDIRQSATHGKQQPNILRERTLKNISGILAVRRRIQNITDANGLSSTSGDANTKTVDLSVSAGNRRIVNFSRTGGPLRPKTYINSRAAKVSDEDRLRNPAVVRTHLQTGDRAVKTGPAGTGFSPVRSGVMRVKDTSPHITNLKPGTNSGLTSSTHDGTTIINPNTDTNSRLTPLTHEEKMAIVNSKPGTNSELTSTTHDGTTIVNSKPGTNSELTSTTHDGTTIINPKPGTNSGLTSSTEDKMAITKLKPGTNSRLTPSTEDEKIAIIDPKPVTNRRLTPSTHANKPEINQNSGTNHGLTPSIEDEKLTVANPQIGTNSGLTSTEDDKMAITNLKPGTNSRLTPSTKDEKLAIINPKPATNRGLTSSTPDDKTEINQKSGMNHGLTPPIEDEKLTAANPKPGTNTRLTPTKHDEKTIINPKPGTNTRLTPTKHDEKTIINPKPGTNTRLTPTKHDGKTIIKPKPGTNTRLTPTKHDEKTIINPKPGTNSRLTPSTHDEQTAIVNTKPGTNSGLTPTTHDEKTIANPKPGTNSGPTQLRHDDKMTNKEDMSTDSDPRTDYENNLKDARQVTMDGEENIRKLNKSVITRVPTNRRKEDQDDVSHTPQTTNKSIASVTNRAEQPDLIKVENEHVGFNAGLVLSSEADMSSSTGKAGSSSPAGQVEKEKHQISVKESDPVTVQEDLRSTVLDKATITVNEKEANPLTADFNNQMQSETFTEAANEEINHNSLSEGTVETDFVNPTRIPSVKMTSADHTVRTAKEVESPVVDQETRRTSIPGSESQPIKQEVVNIQSQNSQKNISRIRDISNMRFGKNITRLTPNLPKRPGRRPTTVIPSGGPKLNTVNIMSGNRSVVVPSNFSISGRNIYFGRRNSTVMMKPSYIRRKPNVQTEPNTSNQNRGFKTNVSAVTQSIKPTGETSTNHTKETKDVPHDVMELNILDNHKLENNRTGSKSLSEIASQNAGDVKHSRDHVAEHSSETVLTSEAVNDTDDFNKENSLQDPLHSPATNPPSGDKESNQFSLGTTDTSSQHPLGVDKLSSMKKELKPQYLGPTASTLKNLELPSVNEKTKSTASNNATFTFPVTDRGESTKHIPAVTNTHVKMVKNISQDTASTPVSFENTVATRELELIKLNEDKVPKYSGDILSNPNSVDNVRGNNGERYTIPVVLETLTNVEEIKGSKVFSLSPEDTADGFKAIAVGDEVTQRDKEENKIHSTCVSDCNSTPTQLPTTQSRPPVDSERGRGLPQDCADYATRTRRNGVYRITPRSQNNTFHVFCDMETAGGGWTLIQQRLDGSTSFNRTWDEYKKGFGKLMGEFWLGNDKIHWLTKTKNMSLRIELEDFDGIREYAEYDHFHVANESQRYRLSIGGYSGTAGNAMEFNKKYNHNQMFFSTPDRDNDQYPSGNCGAYYSSGWWFDACMSANLNGKYYHTKYKGVRNGIFWGTWHNITMEYYPTNERQSFKTVKMMIRPQNYAK